MKATISLVILTMLFYITVAQPAFVTMTGNNDHISVPDDPFWDLPGDFCLVYLPQTILTAFI